MTPLQLASLVSTLANGGTMYYLQYPRTAEERANFTPQIKRQLDIGPLIPDMQEGMLAAVLYGTAQVQLRSVRRAALGKTGTCNDEGLGGRLGWFVSYADQIHPKIVLVVLLRGGSRLVSGPRAADVAGRIYRELRDKNYFVNNEQPDISHCRRCSSPEPAEIFRLSSAIVKPLHSSPFTLHFARCLHRKPLQHYASAVFVACVMLQIASWVGAERMRGI